MRTLTYIVALPFNGWLIDWSYNTLGNDYVGLGAIGMLFITLIMVYWSIRTDWDEEKGKREIKRRRREEGDE